MMIMKNTTCLLLCLIQLSCVFRGVDEVVVSDNPFRLNHVSTEFQCDPPLVRSRRSASLWVELACPWQPEPPWDHIVVEGLGNVLVEATLVSSSGAEFKPTILGAEGGALDMRFEPEIPDDEKLVLIRLKSSHLLDVRNVSWYNFDPL